MPYSQDFELLIKGFDRKGGFAEIDIPRPSKVDERSIFAAMVGFRKQLPEDLLVDLGLEIFPFKRIKETREKDSVFHYSPQESLKVALVEGQKVKLGGPDELKREIVMALKSVLAGAA